MKSVKSTVFCIALLATTSGCIAEGHSPDCGTGGRGSLEAEGCLTPIGGSCLTESEFKANRPLTREDENGVTVTVEDDWIAYQEERTECFDGASP